MYSLKNIFSVQYWFGSVPFLGAPALWTMTIIFGAMLVGGAVINTLANSKKYDKPLAKGLKKISKMLATMGVIAFFLLFFRYEFVVILSRRFMFGLWFVCLILWVIFIVGYFLKIVPKQRMDKMEQERIKKYLP